MIFAPISPMSTESVDSIREFATDSIRSYESSPSSVSSSHPTLVGESGLSRLLLRDQLDVLLVQEKSYQMAFVSCSKAEHQEVGSPQEGWRIKICEWCYRVVDHFRMDRDVVSISMNLFDRYLWLQDNNCNTCKCPSCRGAVDRHTFQLAAVTSLFLGIKVHAQSCINDSSRKRLSISSVLELARGQFSAQDIRDMELRILSMLSWKVNPVIPTNVGKFLLCLMPMQSDVPRDCRSNYLLSLRVLNNIACYLSELAICIPNVSAVFLPSEIAYASILVAMQFLTFSAVPESIRQTFRENVSEMIDTRRIACLMGRLSASFCPGLLFDEPGDNPMTQASYLGLLNLDDIYPTIGRQSPLDDRSTNSIMGVDDDDHRQPDDSVHVISP